MNYGNLKALLIDVDDTLVRFKRSFTPDFQSPTGKRIDRTTSLMHVFYSAGVELAGLTADEVEERIQGVQTEIRWWDWPDFILALDLDPKTFWDYARRIESEYLEPTGPELSAALRRMHDAGILLYVASNNSTTGILHKLRIGGLGAIHGSDIFRQVLGPAELQAMKWDAIYWRKALARLGFDGCEVAVIGDNPRDDYAIPQSAGICHSFLIDREADHSAMNSDSVTYVCNFAQIADCLLNIPIGEPSIEGTLCL